MQNMEIVEKPSFPLGDICLYSPWGEKRSFKQFSVVFLFQFLNFINKKQKEARHLQFRCTAVHVSLYSIILTSLLSLPILFSFLKSVWDAKK